MALGERVVGRVGRRRRAWVQLAAGPRCARVGDDRALTGQRVDADLRHGAGR